MPHFHNQGRGFSTLGFNRLRPELFRETVLERGGDKRYPRLLEKFDQALLTEMGIMPLGQLGEKKLVPMTEFRTIRRERIKRDRMYFNSNPPTAVLDLEDPDREMTRYIHTSGREIITKGSKFLFGKGRFNGVESFIFEKSSAQWEKQWRETWEKNCIDTVLPRSARAALYSGDSFLKVISKATIEMELVVPEGLKPEDLAVKEKRMAEVSFEWLDSENIHAITEKDRPKNVLVWIHQFQRTDGSFFREEIFEDMTLVYGGVKKIDPTSEVKGAQASFRIQGSGIREATIENEAEFIEFMLVNRIEYPEFDDFPLIQFINDPDDDLYGTSVYHGLYGKMDMLNAIFTRSLHALENQATPLLWVSGAQETTGHDVHAADAVWYYPDKDTKLNVLQWQGTPEAVFSFLDRIERQIFRAAGVPRSADLKSFTNVSAEALAIINGDVVDTTNERRLYYEKAFKRMIRLVRKAFGQTKAFEESVVIKWGPIFPESPDKMTEHLLALLRENVIARDYVIKANPFIPSFQKEELMAKARELEEFDARLREENVAAQAKKGVEELTKKPTRRGEGANNKPKNGEKE